MRWLGGVEDPHAVVRQWVDGWEIFPAGKFVVETRPGEIIGRVGLNFLDPETWARSAAAGALPELTVRLPHRARERPLPGVARRLGAVPGETVAEYQESGPHVVWEHPSRPAR